MARIRMMFIVGLSLTFLLPSSAYSADYALLIGIQEYPEIEIPGEPGKLKLWPLHGSGNDIELMKKTLEEVFPNIDVTTLLDEKATHTKIDEAFKALSGDISNGDFVYIHYSGHGSRNPNQNPAQDNEKTGFDQTWVSHGSRMGTDLNNINHFDILDDEINSWLQPILQKEPRIVVIVSDSCHSGTNTRYGGARSIPIHEYGQQHPALKQPRSSTSLKNQAIIRIGAAEDSQKAYEGIPENEDKIYGVFTWFWAKALKEHQNKNWQYGDWQAIFDEAAQNARNEWYQQPYLDRSN